MLVSLSIFIVASVLLCALFALKYYELSRGRRALFSRHRGRVDTHIVKAATLLEETVPQASKDAAVESAHAALYHGTKTLHRGVSSLERRLRSLTDMIRGRRNLKDHNGSASFYLKDIAEHKRQNGYHR